MSGFWTPAVAQVSFEQYEVVTGPAQRQTVLAGSLLGGAIAEIAAVHIDENRGRHLRIYTFVEGGWVLTVEARLRPEVLFVDVAHIGGQDRLITYEQGRVNWFDPESATERQLVTGALTVDPPPLGRIPHVDISRDVNDDDRDDLIVPDVDGSWVFIQTADGRFADPMRIGPSVHLGRIYDAEKYRYDPWEVSRIHQMDYNLDGRSDLVFWYDDRFVVHLQDEQGLLTPVAKTFTTDAAFDSDDPRSIAAPQGFRSRRRDHMPTGDLTGSVLHSLTDLNGDGVADLTVFSLEVESMWSVHSTYEVFFGAPGPEGGTVFAPDAGAVLQLDGVPFGLSLHDFDHDGQPEVMFTTIKVGTFKTLGMFAHAVLTRSVPLKLEFYRMAGGLYPDRPNTSRKIKTDSHGRSGERAARLPSVLIGDISGDGRSDLLLGRNRKELQVYLGTSRPDLFARQPLKVAVVMPNEEYTWLVDLDKDGQQDILMHHPSTTQPNRVTVLLAR